MLYLGDWPLWGLGLIALAVILLARRDRIRAWMARADQARIAERERQAALLRHPHGHMALTVEEIDARTPPVEVVWAEDPVHGTLTKRYLWNGAAFDLQEEADAARTGAILDEARAFYADLDRRQVSEWINRHNATPRR